jgi:hypothetical protein
MFHCTSYLKETPVPIVSTRTRLFEPRYYVLVWFSYWEARRSRAINLLCAFKKMLLDPGLTIILIFVYMFSGPSL